MDREVVFSCTTARAQLMGVLVITDLSYIVRYSGTPVGGIHELCGLLQLYKSYVISLVSLIMNMARQSSSTYKKMQPG